MVERQEHDEQSDNWAQWVAADKLVLTIDYTRRPEQIDDAYARSQARGYVPFVTVRSLGLLIVNPGHEPD